MGLDKLLPAGGVIHICEGIDQLVKMTQGYRQGIRGVQKLRLKLRGQSPRQNQGNWR